jgi:hypothetical protein
MNYRWFFWRKELEIRKISLNLCELSDELNLRFERLSIQSESSNKGRANEELALTTAQLKDKYRDCGLLGHKSLHFKAKRNQENRQSHVKLQPPYCDYCRKTGHIKANFFSITRRNEANGNWNNNVRTGVSGKTADVVFNSVSENLDFRKIFGFETMESLTLEMFLGESQLEIKTPDKKWKLLYVERTIAIYDLF